MRGIEITLVSKGIKITCIILKRSALANQKVFGGIAENNFRVMRYYDKRLMDIVILT
jgi:hypothetical protein